ncbi:MAG: GGDEF domain-containing protein [Pseudomonadota bacterium]
MKVEKDKADFWISIKSKRDVVKATVLVTAVSVLGSWAVTVALMLLAGHTRAEDWAVGITIATLTPMAVAPPVAFKVLNLMLALVDSRREIERLSRTDDLTQTYNRRHFMDMTQRELSLATRHGYVVSLLLIDLDEFKQVNDRLGHLAGDRALAACATTIRGSIRREDVVGRFGGDEFLVLAPYSDLNSAAMLAERIRQALAAVDLMVGGKFMGFKASIGVVSSQGRTGDADELLRMADQALYRAKELGGDRTELAA